MDYLGRNTDKIESQYRGYVDDPYLMNGPAPVNHNACCLSATGEDDKPDTDLPATVKNIQTRQMIKSALALVGAFVVGSYLYKKFIK